MIFRRIWQVILFFFRFLRVFWQLLYGEWRMSKLTGTIVTVFGGSRLKRDDPYFGKAHELSAMLVKEGISVVTGGGPGIMEAASCGAIFDQEGRGKSIGVGVRDLNEGRNQCVEEYFELDYFFARKWLLTRHSIAFAVFPGGFGTMDELAEVLTLIQTKKMPPLPIILFGKEFWQPFMNWITDKALKHGLVSENDIKLFIITDSLQEAFSHLYGACLACGHEPKEKE